MTQFYQGVTDQEHMDSSRRAFRRLGRSVRQKKKHQHKQREMSGAQHKDDRTIGLTTINVRGLASNIKQLSVKLQGTKESHERGQRDVTFLQETHLNPSEHKAAESQYAAMYGFKGRVASKYSCWSSGDDRRAGVAILFNPYGAVSKPEPWGLEWWSEHLIMMTGVMDDKQFLFINVYAPSMGAVRIKFYQRMRRIPFPKDIAVICGGDFNCVLDTEVDRIGGTKKEDMGARDLSILIEHMGLTDAGTSNMPHHRTSRRIQSYANEHHTHRHTSAEGALGTSRLDRWYVRARERKQVRGITTEEPPCKTDHRAVLLEMHAPSGAVRITRRPKLYPPPAYVQSATRSLVQQRLKNFGELLVNTNNADTAILWDAFKTELREEMMNLKKTARLRSARGYRQKVRRLKRQLQRCGFANQGQSRERSSILEKLRQVQEARQAMKKRVLLTKTAWSSKASTKRFFHRICTKFGDNTIPTLVPTAAGPVRGEHDKAEILADSWAPIFNGAAQQKESIPNYVNRLATKWKKENLSDVDDDITEEEVQAAIKRCKSGKACGPDDFGNELYRDNLDAMAPILTIIYNNCMKEGRTPRSFDEAYIFSISKGGNKSNPLNYRPIALLNTDYKIFMRILAWRVRKHIGKLVHTTQYGFVPGRTIHEALDMYEAAKEICGRGGALSAAQVLLLDFAKAYDSLDRDFLLEVLERKGFPPKFCQVVKAIHANTSVRFMANGRLSRPVTVTSGIRQGCPLAPLLFILAVDLLYDEVDGDTRIRGIALDTTDAGITVKIAGYADDTAIYLAHKNMQPAAIAAVARFSAVSGLMLNVHKSAAVRLGRDMSQEVAESTIEKDNEADSQEDAIAEVQQVRYLGHIAGPSNITARAWAKAFDALRVRLALAQDKTNTVQQRAAIAAAIIVPKLLYVARHAWPTTELAKQADLRIRNFIWNSNFAHPESTPVGWVKSALAEQGVKDGGLGVPNITVELSAMSAAMVGDWASTTSKKKQCIGSILQGRNGERRKVVPTDIQPKLELRGSAFETGQPWIEWAWAPQNVGNEEMMAGSEQLRRELRHRNGLTTKWTTTGLEVTCTGRCRDELAKAKQQRQDLRGAFLHDGLTDMPLADLHMWSDHGERRKWGDYKHLITEGRTRRVKDLMHVKKCGAGKVVFQPTQLELPMASAVAHLFREVCLNLLGCVPEIIFQQKEAELIHFHHEGDDKHHLFTVQEPNQKTIMHTWGPETTLVKWDSASSAVEEAIAGVLEAPVRTVWATPHPWLTMTTPLWAGKRRWARSRKQLKRLICNKRNLNADKALQDIRTRWAVNHQRIASALDKLPWSRVHRMEGVSPYQAQNVARLKSNRLRLWTGKDKGLRCAATTCVGCFTSGAAHLIWECPDAQAHWDIFRTQWGRGAPAGRRGAVDGEVDIPEIFGFKLATVPRWLTKWGAERSDTQWDILYEVANEMWALGCAVTVTAIWRRNVDRLHPEGKPPNTLREQLGVYSNMVKEAYIRYQFALYPFTAFSKCKIEIAQQIKWRWCQSDWTREATVNEAVTRVGFFDGGSRGNPGPGGSGSVVVQIGSDIRSSTALWAAATAMGRPTTTNNEAEFMGLHRLLSRAVDRNWKGIHIVGDSAMILQMMRTRRQPKSRKMRHWYRLTSKLADMCEVKTWSHHYRQFNRMADWLANRAMDSGRSVMQVLGGTEEVLSLQAGIDARLEGDVTHWKQAEQRRAEEQMQ